LLSVAGQRPELRALLEREAAAQNRLKVERSAAYPDITVGLSTLREGPPELRERATVLSVTVPLPFFNRNQAGIGRALAERDRAQIEREAALRNGEALVRELWQRLQLLQTRVGRLSNSVLPRLDENLSLSSKAYQAGELGILQLLLVNRQVLDARRDYLEALGDFTQVRISMELAAALHGPDAATPTYSRSPKTP
jgi:cobalt-zinc-cadmium efflux system outer membrane protein